MVFLIVMVLCSLMVEACPADFVPEGYTKQAAVQSAAGGRDKNWKEMLQTPIFLCHDHFTGLRSFQWHDDYLTAAGLAQKWLND